MGSDHYCLRWNNHQRNLLGVFRELFESGSLVDVTLASSEGHSLRAHKVVLSACSTYFQSLFLDHPSNHPIVILKDVSYSELTTLVQFMYRGEVSVETCRLSALLKTAESLKVKGLAEMTSLSENGKIKEESMERGDGSSPAKSDGTSGPGEGEGGSERLQAEESAKEEEREEGRDEKRVEGVGRAKSEERVGGGTDSGPGTPDQPHLQHPPPAHNQDRDCRSASPPSDLRLAPSPAQEADPTSPLPGPSCLPPVQDAPLSLKKEVDWEKEENRSTTCESSLSDFSRHPHDPVDGRCMYTCMYCGLGFVHQSKLARHILSHSLESLKYREAQAAQAAQMYLAPMLSQPPQPLPQVQCDLDSPGRGMRSDLQSGALCKFCGKTFPDVGSLIAHLPAHTGDRPFKCEFCGKAFKLRHHMKDHCRVHTGERPFRCSMCGKTFSRSTILKAHEKTHFPKSLRKWMSSPSPPEEGPPRPEPPGPPPPFHPMPCDLSLPPDHHHPLHYLHRSKPSP